MNRLLTALISNTVFANVVLAAIIFSGTLALLNIRRESMPEISLHALQVQIALPGADPQEVEEGISRRIESAVDGLEGVKQYSTTSLEGWAMATIEIEDGYEIEAMKDRVRDAIDGISTFPAETERPQISHIKDEEEVIELALWGGLPERQLKQWAEEIRAELQRLPEVSLVYVVNTRPYEVKVDVLRERLLEYGLTVEDIGRAIRQGNVNASAGIIENDAEEISIRALGRKYTGQEFAKTVVKALPNGEVLTLDQVATVTDAFADEPVYATFNGQPCVLVAVEKGEGEDSLAIAEAVRNYARDAQQTLPEGLHISPAFDNSEFIEGQVALLARNGMVGLVLVLVLLWLFLDTRLAFWVAMGIPISIAGALVYMWVSGATINQISLVTFIIVLGIIVDDAIVVGEAIHYQRRLGKSPLVAAVDGVREVGMPVLAAVTTTMAAFLPLAFVGGIMGQIMRIMPPVVIGALAVSLVESLFLLPAHLNNLPESKARDAADKGLMARMTRWHRLPAKALTWISEHYYLAAVRRVIAHRYLMLCAATSVILIMAGVIGGGHLRVVFWPPVDGDNIRAFVEFPPGTPVEVTRDAVDRTREGLERVAARLETTSGKSIIRNMYTVVQQGSTRMGRVSVELLTTSERGIHAQDISAAWEKEVGSIPGAVSQVYMDSQINVGGLPIEIWLQGKEMDELVLAGAQIREKLGAYDGVYQIEDDFRPGKTEVQVRLKPEAHTLGLTLEWVAAQLRSGYYGNEAVRFQRGRDDVRVRVRFPEEQRTTLTQLEHQRIRTPQGAEVPLMSIADVSLAQGYASIRGTNGMRRLVITAAVDVNVANAQEVLAELSSGFLDGVVSQYRQMSWDFRGSAESNQETLDGLQTGFAMALVAIFVIMATIFRSYAQPFIILLVIPFGIIGAIIGHLVMGIPLTFLSMFGIIALTGVVVNDAIVLVECVNELLSEGMSFSEALARAGVRRFRAVFLTTATTCIGLLPLVLEKDLQAQIVIPMAVSISFGVAFATIITLFLIPCLLGILNDLRRGVYRVRAGVWPLPEEVEPGLNRKAIREAQEELLGTAPSPSS